MLRTPFAPTLRGGPAVAAISDLVPAIGDGVLLARPRGDEERLPHAQSRGEIAFVDAGISDLATLLSGLKPGVEVVMLDSAHDAIGQIAAALAGRDSLAAIHIIANGGEGRIDFGAGGVGLAELADHAGDLAAIGNALGADGDILLWSCNTGAGSIGQAFVVSLAQATGADVAASTDPTGAAARGGDWALEAQSGSVEARVPLTPWGVDHFDGLLDNAAPAAAFAASPVGGELIVNADTAGTQQTPAAATLSGGGYVVLWSGNGSGDVSGIFVQRFDASGALAGGEVRANTTTAGTQGAPSVAALSDGSYVVTWQSLEDVNFTTSVFMQRYDASGAALGGETQVNTSTTPTHINPSAVALSGGGYVIAWNGNGTGDSTGVFMQRYDNAGTALGGETLVNTTIASDQSSAAIGALSDGGYVVAWQGNGATDVVGIYAQRYDASGAAVGGEVRVNTVTTGNQVAAAVAGLADGGYVITWNGNGTGDTDGVFAQRYDASGAAVGGEVLVNTTTSRAQSISSVAGLADGGYVVTWQYDASAGNIEVYSQRYDASGAPVGGETQVATLTSNDQTAPVVTPASDGRGYFIAWESEAQEGNAGKNIAGQLFGTTLSATEQVAHDLKGSIAISDADAGDTLTVTLAVDYGVLHLAEGTSGATIVSGNDSISVVVSGTAAQIQALLGSDATSVVTFTADTDTPPDSASLTVTVDDGTATPVSDTTDIAITAVNDAAELDLDFLTPGNDAVATYVAGDPAVPISFNATFDDDNANWDGATLTVAITGATADDQLAIDETLMIDTTVVGHDIFYQGDLVGSWSGGANGDPLVVTFNADACACAIEEVTYGIAYSNGGTVTGVSTRDVTYTFVDGGGTANGGHDTATATVELTVTPAPTPPVIDAGATANGNEDSAFALTGITITDAGDPATGLITVHLGVVHGTLTIRTDVPGGIDASNIVNSASGHGITIIATPDQINATLAANGLSYLGDANFNGADALTITANDGTPDTALAISSLGAQPFFDFPSAVAFHDVDGDGYDDLILGIGDGSTPGAVLVLSGGIGGFGLHSGAADAFAFGDFDGDGTIDIGIASYAADGSGYVGYHSSLIGAMVEIANVPYALDLIAGDFNGDGLMDLAAANSDSGNIAILLQTAPGVFAPPVYSSATSLLTVSIRTGDFNGDGKLDLLASNFGDSTGFAPPGSIDLFLGNGDGTFGAATQVWAGPSNADGLVVGDFNGDGVQDFAFASVDTVGVPGGVNGIQVVLGNGDGTFGAATGYVTTAGGSPHNIVAGDLNNDGITDLVVTNSDTPGTVSILIGNGDGSFQAPVDLDTGDLPYVVALGDPDDDGDLDLIVGSAGDGTYEAFNNDDFHRGSSAVKPIAVAGSAVAQADAATIAENAISTGNLFLNNGSGADSDSDGDALVIALVNGSAANVGTMITLASGAKLTVNADGSYSYDPNGKFVTLTDGSSGAVNTLATDSFTYTLAGGNTATVTITLNGVAGAGDRLQGDLTHDVIHGTGGADFFIDTAGGNEDWTGLGGNDVFLFGATLTSADKVDGGAGADQLAIQGDYSSQLTLGTGIVGVEYMAILPGSDTRFGDPGTNSYDYNIKTVDQNVAAGVTFTVDANRLSVGEDFTFDGSAETDGKFFIWGGGGTDTLTGGTQNDTFYFGELGQFGATDTVNGGAGTDQLGLRGDYSIVFGAAQLTSIENIGMVSAFDTRFGALGASFDYDLTMDDGNVVAGQQMTVDAAALRASETLTFNGSAELDGSFRVFGGAGDDVIVGSHGDDILVGWAGADTLTGGLGNDVFRYNLASDSTSASHDTIQDFTLGDIIDLSRIDANSGVNGDQAFSFIGNTAFGHHAGELRYENVSGSTWTVQGDTDGDGVADFEVVVVIADGHGFTGGDFLM